MILLRSLAFNLSFFTVTAAFAIAGLPVLLLPVDAAIRLSRAWVRTIIAMLRAFCGIDHEVRGLDHRPAGAALIASKHQSAWDTLIMPLLLDAPVYVLKKELLAIPVFGWHLRRTGQIAIDRRAGTAAIRKLLRQAREVLEAGRPIVIYPEGTRSAPGRTGDYHSGIAALYKNLDRPVVPVALNSGLFWGRRRFRKTPGTIVVEFLEPIPPGLAPRAFLMMLEQRIEGATRRLEQEATTAGRPKPPTGAAAVSSP